MMDLLPKKVRKPTQAELEEAMEDLYLNPDDKDALEVLERLTSHNANAPSKRSLPEIRAIIASNPEYAQFASFMEVLTEANEVKFSQIYGYMKEKKILLHNIILQTISIHSGIKVEGSTPQKIHSGILFYGPSGE